MTPSALKAAVAGLAAKECVTNGGITARQARLALAALAASPAPTEEASRGPGDRTHPAPSRPPRAAHLCGHQRSVPGCGGCDPEVRRLVPPRCGRRIAVAPGVSQACALAAGHTAACAPAMGARRG